ncbi:hypothetical protein [Micromonospora wenchangensis]|uniref:hypothetical protein n=1 Tax=Micromonospora wenchangensis TaxID=1185415 RepID=UPI0037F256D4
MVDVDDVTGRHHGERTPPAPAATLSLGDVRLMSDVEAWIAEKRPHLLESAEEA